MTHTPSIEHRLELSTEMEGSKLNPVPSPSRSQKQNVPDKKKKKGLFGGLFGRKKQSDGGATPASSRAASRSKI